LLSDVPALDVAIGLSFVFFVLAVFATALREAGAALLGTRSRTLEAWLQENLAPPSTVRLKRKDKKANPDVQAAAQTKDAIFEHPLINGLTRTSGLRTRSGKPSYIPSDQFVTALLSVGKTRPAIIKRAEAVKADAQADASIAFEVVMLTKAEVKAALDGLPQSPIRAAMLDIYARAGNDMEHFRRSAEEWFDDSMDRLSGWYKRRTQAIVWGIGLALAVLINADLFKIAEALWRDPTARSALVNQASHAADPGSSAGAQSAYGQIQALPLPIGWGGHGGHFPGWWTWNLPIKVVGLLLTAAAVGLGAPFWFDTLTRLGSLRSTGPRPAAATQAVAPIINVGAAPGKTP